MKERLRQLPAVFVALSLVPLSLMPARASETWVYWALDVGFYTSDVAINPGDTVYIANVDSYGFTVNVFGSPPESFSIYNLQPGYYDFHQYDTPGTFNFYDNYGDTVYVHVNSLQPVAVVITDPTNHSALTAPATFTITAQPSGGTSPYNNVEFFVGTISLGYDYAAPFTSTVTNLPAGTYDISAVATDYNFNQATNTITITVNPLVLGYPRIAGDKLVFDLSGLTLGKTNILQSSGNLSSWSDLNTSVATSLSTTITNSLLTGPRFFRVVQLP